MLGDLLCVHIAGEGGVTSLSLGAADGPDGPIDLKGESLDNIQGRRIGGKTARPRRFAETIIAAELLLATPWGGR